MSPQARRRKEMALARREQQLVKYMMGDLTTSKGEPLWRAGQPHEHRIIEIAERDIANLRAKLGITYNA